MNDRANRADRGALHPTAQKLVDQTLEMINEIGIGGVQVTNVLEATRISVGSFYHHFENREDLLRVTLEHRFIQTLQRGITQMSTQLATATTIEEILVTFASLQVQLFSDPAMRRERHRRVEILGYALSSARALEDVARVIENALVALCGLLSSFRQRGLIRDEIDIDEFARWMFGLQIGRILADIHPIDEVGNATWVTCSVRAIAALLAPEGLPTERIDEILRTATPIAPPSLRPDPPASANLPTQWPERWTPLSRLHPTARALIEVTIQALDEVGEDGLRVEQILSDSGISVGSLYHHFHDREGLIVAADTQRFVSSTADTIDAWVFAAGRTTTTRDFVHLVRANVASATNDERGAINRKRQLQVLASALSRPKLLEDIVAAQRYVVTYIARVFDRARARGLTPNDIDPKGYVLWLLGMQFGRVVAELLPDAGNVQVWTKVAQRAAQAPLIEVSSAVQQVQG